LEGGFLFLLNKSNTMATYVILPETDRIFHGEKKLHSSGRRTSQKVKVINNPALCEKVGEQMFDNQLCVHLRLVCGDLKVWQRAELNWNGEHSGFNFYVPVEVELKETEFGELVKNAIKDSSWKHARVIIKKDGKNVVSRISGIDVEKTLEKGEIYVRTGDDILLKLSEAAYVKETSEAETLALSKEMAKTYGLRITNVDDVLEDDHEPEFNILSFDFYRNVQGRICIHESKFDQFEKELLKLAEKYHVPVTEHGMELDPVEDLHNYSIGSEELQVYFHGKKNVEEVFHDHRGQINGAKFGL